MKLYLIPVESICNGACNFCITKFRQKINSEFIELSALNQINKFKNITKIEITGGGEPALHPKIKEIISVCSKKGKTSIYTNGTLCPPLDKDVEICVSRIHYTNDINEKLMGVKYNFNKFKSYDVKLSLMLHKDGINSPTEIEKYLFWAKEKGVKKVVIRKIAFNNYWKSYEISKQNNVEINDLIIKQIKNNFGDFVEFDFESCTDNNLNLILRSDGQFYSDWNSLVSLSEDNFLLTYLKKISLTSTCLGRKVSAIIIKDNKIIGIGSNSNSDCLKKKICNRIATNKNDDYSACLCTHAEVSAITDALGSKNDLSDSKMFIYGHHTICGGCKNILKKYNIHAEVIK